MSHLFFSDEYIQKIQTSNDPEFIKIKTYLEELTEKEDKNILHPFCVACGIENKYQKFAWHLLACEMKLFSLSILWLIEQNPKYLEKVRKTLFYLIDLPNWSDNYNRYNKTKNTYPETAAVMRGFAVVIDIFGTSIGHSLLKQIEKRLSFACQRLYEIIENKEETFILDYTDDWALDLSTALGIGGIILKNYDDRSEKWILTSKKLVKKYIDNLPIDGSHRNGLLRWEYSLFNIYTFLFILKRSGDKEIFFTPTLKKSIYFALNLSSPKCANICQFDQSIHISVYNPLNGVLSKLLCDIYNDEYLNWGIQNAPSKDYYHPIEIFFTNKKNTLQVPETLKSVYYPQAGIISMRSGWKDKDNLITFKSYGNRQGFSHKDQNNMEIFLGNKEMFIESGTCFLGHPNYENRYFGTHAHNVILIDGKPQLPKGNGKGGIKAFVSNDKFDYTRGDASGVYSKAKTYLRNLLFIKPNILIIYDYVLLNSAGNIEWLWHTPGSVHVHSLSKMKSILFKNQDKNMSMFILNPENWSYKLTKDYVLDNWWNMHERTHDVLRVKATYKNEYNFISLLHLNSEDHENLPCEYENNIIKLNYLNTEYNISYDKGILFLNNNEIK